MVICDMPSEILIILMFFYILPKFMRKKKSLKNWFNLFPLEFRAKPIAADSRQEVSVMFRIITTEVVIPYCIVKLLPRGLQHGPLAPAWIFPGAGESMYIRGGLMMGDAGEIFKNFQRLSIKLQIFDKIFLIFNENFAIFPENSENYLHFLRKFGHKFRKC